MADPHQHPGGSLLRTTALIAIGVSAAASLGLMFHASDRRPPLLMAIFVVWILAPFVSLVLADKFSPRWSVLTRTTLYSLMLVVALGSLAAYGYDAVRPRHAQAAFVYVMIPPVSCLLIATALAIAALISSRRHAEGHGA
jgi:K+-transporting ATPase A subunit